MLMSIIKQIGLDGAVKLLSYGSVILGILYFMNSVMDTRAEKVRLQNENRQLVKTLKIRELELSLGKEAMSTLDNACKAQAARFIREHDIWKKIDDSKDPLTDAANFSIESKK